MASIPLEALSVLFFLLPGYLAFYLIKKFAPLVRKYPEHEKLIRSLLLSFVVWTFLIIIRLKKLDDLSIIFEAENTLWLLLMTFLVSLIMIGFYKAYYHFVRIHLNHLDPWNIFMQDLIKADIPVVIIRTKAGDFFSGLVKYASSHEQEKEIVLEQPRRVIQTENEIQELPFGNRIYFNSKDIEYIWDLSKK